MKSNDRDPNEERNPFVAFRHFIDDQFRALPESFTLPDLEKQLSAAYDQQQQAAIETRNQLHDLKKEALAKFERNYERATNPERRQSKPRTPEAPPLPAKTVPHDSASKESRPSIFGKMLGYLGKTSPAEEAARALKIQSREQEKSKEVEASPTDPPPESKSNPIQTVRVDFPFRTAMLGPLSSIQDLEHAMEEARRNAESFTRDLRESLAEEERMDKEVLQYQSNYSPLRLENDTAMGQRLNWRHAFEDLMCAERGEPLQGEYWGGYVPPQTLGCWLTNLLWRGHLDFNDSWHQSVFGMCPWPQDSYEARLEDMTNDSKSAAYPRTELDVYDLFPRSFGQDRAPTRLAIPEETVKPPNNGPEEGIGRFIDQLSSHAHQEASYTPSLRSIVTTVERRRMPDGSATTQRVITRHFTDGHEESEDITESTPPSQQGMAFTSEESQPYSLAAKIREEEDKLKRSEKPNNKPSGGLFW